MARHDYDLPPEWEAMSPDARNDWMIQERCRRQAMNQDTAFRRRVEQEQERQSRMDRFRKFFKLG